MSGFGFAEFEIFNLLLRLFRDAEKYYRIETMVKVQILSLIHLQLTKALRSLVKRIQRLLHATNLYTIIIKFHHLVSGLFKVF